MRSLCLKLGKPIQTDAMFGMLKEAEAAKTICFASAETAVKNAEMVRKLLRVADVATAAEGYDRLCTGRTDL